jgi:glutamyl-Q tRNA(Asp) synthetase
MGEDGKKLSKQSLAWPVDGKDPLPTLINAARFLGQIPKDEPPSNLDEFWQWAISSWNRENIPVQKY